MTCQDWQAISRCSSFHRLWERLGRHIHKWIRAPQLRSGAKGVRLQSWHFLDGRGWVETQADHPRHWVLDGQVPGSQEGSCFWCFFSFFPFFIFCLRRSCLTRDDFRTYTNSACLSHHGFWPSTRSTTSWVLHWSTCWTVFLDLGVRVNYCMESFRFLVTKSKAFSCQHSRWRVELQGPGPWHFVIEGLGIWNQFEAT